MMKPEWPQVRCQICGKEAHWRQMIRKQEWVHIQETKDDAPDKWVEWHVCPSCEALATGQTEAQVMEANFQKPIEHKKVRVQRFKEVRKKYRQQYEALGSLGQKRIFLRMKMEEMFAPLGEYIKLKNKALAIVAKDLEAHDVLRQKLKKSSSLQEDAEIYKAMTLLEVDDKYIAYESKGKAQHSYIRASSYRDVWVSSKAGTVTSYYICLAKTRWDPGADQPRKCRRLTESKRWDKRKDDTQEEWVSKQRWYCQCRARYHGKWGQVAIIEEPDGRVSYVRTECPSWDVEDVRAMQTEATVSAGSVKELYDKIRSIEPVANDIVGVDAGGCKYIKKYEDFQAMPFFSWDELLTLKGEFGKL